MTALFARLTAAPFWAKLAAIGLVIGLSFVLFAGVARVWNGFGNWVFSKQIASKQKQLDKANAEIAKGKEAVAKALEELAAANQKYVDAKKDTDRAREILNDSTKSSQQKVAEFRKALAAEPDRSGPADVTTDDLCAKARAAGASAELTKALCGG